MKAEKERFGFTLVELLVVISIIGILASILLPGLVQAREYANRMSCANNLKQIYMSMTMYADEWSGRFPPGDDNILFYEENVQNGGISGDNIIWTRNNYMVQGSSLFPNYLDDLTVFACPSDTEYEKEKVFRDLTYDPEYRPSDVGTDPRDAYWVGGTTVNPFDTDCLFSMSYIYLPYAIVGDLQGLALFTVLDDMMHGREYYDAYLWGFMDEDIVFPYAEFFDLGTGGGNTVFRLRQGIERFFITDIRRPERSVVSSTQLPIMFDTIRSDPRDRNHFPGGGNVLYMDGHVEFIRFPDRRGRIPYTLYFVDLLDTIRAYNIPPWCYESDLEFRPRWEFFPSEYGDLYGGYNPSPNP